MIELEREPDDDPPMERCCFCRKVTKFWTRLSGRKPGQQVACCQECGKTATDKDVPTKKDWCRREQIAMGPKFASFGSMNWKPTDS